jgi:hypothetical protein
LLRRRRREQRIAKEGGGSGGKYSSDTRWKSATWTPWLWVK